MQKSSFGYAVIEFRLRGNRAESRFNCRQVEIQLPLVVGAASRKEVSPIPTP
ncbi:MAG: hypothetical protein V7L20_15265 [Nostoc sp.]|uniref:hypothetical protein n=1 Tax=Nostoc sp. TaxID=1180 RepID=UPI002FFB426A